MKFTDIFLSILIIIIFVIIFFSNVLLIGREKIRKNWNKYRCNPMVMPFARFFGHNTMKNFVFCIQNMQANYMEEVMKPLQSNIKINNQTSMNLGNSMQSMRNMMNQTRSFGGFMFEKIFSVFFNTLIQLQYMMIKLKSVFAKTIGITTAMLYLVDGSVKTGESIWVGPVGGMLRTLCFHPSTILHMDDGSIKTMETIKLGDKLENGSIVTGTLRLENTTNEPLYRIYSKTHNQHILVTAHHLIRDETENKFVTVKDHKDAEETNDIIKEFCCLITDDHLITIGEYTFWDYEDDKVLACSECNK